MSNLINQIKLILNNKKGETLIESITSILLFTMLLLTIGAIITVSVKINANTNEKGAILQNAVNEIRTSTATDLPFKKGTITFTKSTESTPIDTVDIKITNDSIIAFTPVVTP